MNVTKNYVSLLWNLQEFGTTQKPSINDLRLFMYLMKNNDGMGTSLIINRKDIIYDLWSYKKNGKTIKLFDPKRAFEFILKHKICTYNTSMDEFTFNLNSDLFKINGIRKKDWNYKREKEKKYNPYGDRGDYQEGVYKKINDNIWDIIRFNNVMLEYKLFFFILWERMSSPSKIIRTNTSDLKKTLCINDSDNSRLKRLIIKVLDKFLSINYITNYNISKHRFIIER